MIDKNILEKVSALINKEFFESSSKLPSRKIIKEISQNVSQKSVKKSFRESDREDFLRQQNGSKKAIKSQEVKEGGQRMIESALYVVGVPIGNLADITLRAISVLFAADVIICEDSRNTFKLLEALSIKGKKLVIYNDQSDDKNRNQIMNFLNNNLAVAMVCDAGTPLISDPGYKLLNFLRSENKNYQIKIVPGVSSLTAALSGAGIACEQFAFFGFLPPKDLAKINLIQILSPSITAVFFESPNRIQKTLKIISEILPNRRVCLARELTKIFEEFLIDYPEKIIADLEKNHEKLCGEMVLMIEKEQKNKSFEVDSNKESGSQYSNQAINLINMIDEMLKNGYLVRQIAEEISQNLGLSKKEVYRLATQRRSISVGSK